MRDRLIAILEQADFDFGRNAVDCALDNADSENYYEFIASHLLANGVIVPPIGLGRTCFDIRAKCLDECRVSSVTQKADCSLKIRITNLRYRAAYEITPDEIGKTVFLTREEAEAALAEREGKG